MNQLAYGRQYSIKRPCDYSCVIYQKKAVNWMVLGVHFLAVNSSSAIHWGIVPLLILLPSCHSGEKGGNTELVLLSFFSVSSS